MDDTTRGLVQRVDVWPWGGAATGICQRSRTGRRTAIRIQIDGRREIRAEIEHTREEMSETIDAIQERLRPGNIVAGAAERVREATTEGVRNMAESASETARNAMEQTREMTGDVAEFGRENAIPAALIGVGVAWLVIDRIRDDRNHRSWDRWSRDRESYRFGASRVRHLGRYDRDSRSICAGQQLVGYHGPHGLDRPGCRADGEQDRSQSAEPAATPDAGEPTDGWCGGGGHRRRRWHVASRNRAGE